MAHHTIEELQQMANEYGKDSHQQMVDMTADMVGELENLEYDEFDMKFIAMTILHHKQMLILSELVETRSAHDQLKSFADDMINHQDKEIQKLQAWQNKWGLR